MSSLPAVSDEFKSAMFGDVGEDDDGDQTVIKKMQKEGEKKV